MCCGGVSMSHVHVYVHTVLVRVSRVIFVAYCLLNWKLLVPSQLTTCFRHHGRITRHNHDHRHDMSEPLPGAPFLSRHARSSSLAPPTPTHLPDVYPVCLSCFLSHIVVLASCTGASSQIRSHLPVGVSPRSPHLAFVLHSSRHINLHPHCPCSCSCSRPSLAFDFNPITAATAAAAAAAAAARIGTAGATTSKRVASRRTVDGSTARHEQRRRVEAAEPP